MKELFLCAALALPALPWNPAGEYQLLLKFLYRNPEYMGYQIILVNQKEQAIGPEYTATRVYFKEWRVWLKKIDRRSA